MRFSPATTVLCLSLLSLAGTLAAAAPATTASFSAAATSAIAAAKPSPAAQSTADAAAKRHAKRTACLKNARTKKLIGPDKTAFLKNCIAAP